jgi:hypothetical protein
MLAKRSYYSAPIDSFLEQDQEKIVGTIMMNAQHDINDETKRSWMEEIEVLKTVLLPYSQKGTVYFEYNIPRMGRRVDVVAVIENIVFLLEFKTANNEFTREAYIQVWDYAIDLKNFQEGSADRYLVPMVVAPHEKDRNCKLDLVFSDDRVFQPMFVNANNLQKGIDRVLKSVLHSKIYQNELDERWAKSGYSPTPTIIEAAIALYNQNTVEDITKHDADLDSTAECIRKIIKTCKENNQKAICFVTGVPGAGKTLIGLNTAIEQYKAGEKAIYLSGNFPLVEVLQEALARDYVKRQKENGEKCTKKETRSQVKAFIQIIHHYRDLYLEGTEIKDGHVVPIPGYFARNTDKAYIPVEHVAIFDEAQRAWTKEELCRFMDSKKGKKGFPYSEPEYLISCMDRQIDWGLVICLIGGGQEINKGEAGIQEWIDSLNRSFPQWHVYMSDQLTEQEYAGGKAIESFVHQENLHKVSHLHLPVSMRSFRAEKVSTFVHQLLELKQQEAKETLKELERYPIVLTRSLDKAKEWLRSKARGSERIGILASSKAERLKAISINVRYQPDFVQWFLADDDDIRSSNCLEDTLTEFKVQGLEIDWACVAWDADLRISKDFSHWSHYQLRGGEKWQNINKVINQQYQINAYRVLLTRARQGMIIVVPEGDHSIPPDKTRNPEWYDNIYKYLRGIGIPEI